MEAFLDKPLFCLTSPLNKSSDFRMLKPFVLALVGKKAVWDAGRIHLVFLWHHIMILISLYAKSFLNSWEEVCRHNEVETCQFHSRGWNNTLLPLRKQIYLAYYQSANAYLHTHVQRTHNGLEKAHIYPQVRKDLTTHRVFWDNRDLMLHFKTQVRICHLAWALVVTVWAKEFNSDCFIWIKKKRKS